MPPHSSRFCSPPIAGLVIALVFAGCGTRDAVVGPPPRTDAGQFWALTLNYHAITLSTVAPHDTIRLTATPRDAAGNPLRGLPTPAFRSNDLARVTVDSQGVVHAVKAGAEVHVIASLEMGSVTLADTAAVNVTTLASPPTLALLSIHPAPGDSAETSIDQPLTLPTYALDSSGAPISGLAVDYRASDNKTARIDRYSGLIQGVYPGHVTLTATATAYGVTKADTVLYVMGWPVYSTLSIVPQITKTGQSVNGFLPNHMTLGAGATVLFGNETFALTDVTFDNPAAVDSSALYCFYAQFGFPWLCATGNIAPFANDTTILGSDLRARSFPVPGTYLYHSTIFGTTGKIVVIDWHTL
jgi:hypothetical protein